MQGQTLVLNKTFPEFFSEALRKTRSTCRVKRTLVCKFSARAGTDLDCFFFIKPDKWCQVLHVMISGQTHVKTLSEKITESVKF